ncbi:MAG: HugZ family protein [Bacteriovoracaceae bacterium]
MEKDHLGLALSDSKSIESGVLSTFSVDAEGYPFGSVTPFVLDYSNKPLIYISSIAQHTQNIQNNSKCCLTIFENTKETQNKFRVTIIGDAVKSEDPLQQELYYKLFPHARNFSKTHDFFLYSIDPIRVRYIGGFGKIFWIEKQQWNIDQAQWRQEQEEILSHLNTDHKDIIELMIKSFGEQDSSASIVTLDPRGCHLKGNKNIYYFSFDEVCLTKNQLRESFIRIAKRLKI